METVREQILILISTPIYLVIIGLEILLSNLQHQKAYTVKDTVSNVYLMLLNSLIDLMFRASHEAVRLVDDVDWAGVTAQFAGPAFTAASTDRRVMIVDEGQYGQGDGPCLQALRTDRPVSIVGREGMDFISGGYLLSHALGTSKPWRKSMCHHPRRNSPSVTACNDGLLSNCTRRLCNDCCASSTVPTSTRPSFEITGCVYSPMPDVSRVSRPDARSRHHRLRSTVSGFAA